MSVFRGVLYFKCRKVRKLFWKLWYKSKFFVPPKKRKSPWIFLLLFDENSIYLNKQKHPQVDCGQRAPICAAQWLGNFPLKMDEIAHTIERSKSGFCDLNILNLFWTLTWLVSLLPGLFSLCRFPPWLSGNAIGE